MKSEPCAGYGTPNLSVLLEINLTAAIRIFQRVSSDLYTSCRLLIHVLQLIQRESYPVFCVVLR